MQLGHWYERTALAHHGRPESDHNRQIPVLSWYYEEFRKHLKRRDAKLMIVGYSFSDAHINEAILDGIKSGNLKIFIIDSAGLNILDKRDPRVTFPIARAS